MNRKPHMKHKAYKKSSHDKLGICMILLGIVAIAALFLPLKYWALLLSSFLIFFGLLLLK